MLKTSLNSYNIEKDSSEKGSEVLPSFVEIPKKKENLKNPLNWGVDQVVFWVSSLNLSKSYSDLIKSNNINGIILKTMNTRKDWQNLGITTFSDLYTVAASVNDLFSPK